jgi:hypothetical protein
MVDVLPTKLYDDYKHQTLLYIGSALSIALVWKVGILVA